METKIDQHCHTCTIFDPDVLTAAIHLQQRKKLGWANGQVTFHFTPEGGINLNRVEEFRCVKSDITTNGGKILS